MLAVLAGKCDSKDKSTLDPELIGLFWSNEEFLLLWFCDADDDDNIVCNADACDLLFLMIDSDDLNNDRLAVVGVYGLIVSIDSIRLVIDGWRVLP
jgi:hypothetical protein